MILQKREVETERPKTNATGHKTFYSLSVTAGRTNYIFKKAKPSQQIQVSGLSKFRSIKQQNHSPPFQARRATKNYPDIKIEPTNEISCTSFMKSYIEKLKKERKRQNKKLKDSRNNKQQSERVNFVSKSETGKHEMYLAKQMNHIFILQKVPKKGGSLMNTISVVEEDINDFRRADKIRKQNMQQQKKWDEPSWANKEKIQKLIKQIRNSRNKIGGEQIFGNVEEVQKHKSNESYNLPSLPNKSREMRSRTKSKQLSRVPQLNFRTLEPWKQDQNLQEFSIEQYNEK